MKRAILLAFAASILAGCHAPVPSFNVLAPYGTSRIAPPATGSYGSANMYYASPPNNATSRLDKAPQDSPPVPGTLASAKSNASGSTRWQPARLEPTVVNTNKAVGTGVVETAAAKPAKATAVPVVHTRPIESAGEEPAVRIVESTGDSIDRPASARAMPARDLTGGSPPRPFVPDQNATEISQLPAARTTQPNPSGLKWRSR